MSWLDVRTPRTFFYSSYSEGIVNCNQYKKNNNSNDKWLLDKVGRTKFLTDWQLNIQFKSKTWIVILSYRDLPPSLPPTSHLLSLRESGLTTTSSQFRQASDNFYKIYIQLQLKITQLRNYLGKFNYYYLRFSVRMRI